MSDFFDDFGWEEMGMLGALAEEMSQQERERLRLEKEVEKELEEQAENEEQIEQIEPCCCEGEISDPDDDCEY